MDSETEKFIAGMREPQVPSVPFEEYAETFAYAFELTREDSILEIKMHTQGGSAVFGNSKHRGWSQLLKLVGDDPENEVVIITGAGEDFVAPIPQNILELVGQHGTQDLKDVAATKYRMHMEGKDLIYSLTRAVHVPTIGAINGPASAMAGIGLLCDLTICSDTTTLVEPHFGTGMAPADGNWQAFCGLAGIKRSAYMAYTCEVIDAQTALDWGLVNEVVPAASVHERAWELARQIMKADKYCRRITHELVSSRYDAIINDMRTEFGYQAFADYLTESNLGLLS